MWLESLYIPFHETLSSVSVEAKHVLVLLVDNRKGVFGGGQNTFFSNELIKDKSLSRGTKPPKSPESMIKNKLVKDSKVYKSTNKPIKFPWNFYQ